MILAGSSRRLLEGAAAPFLLRVCALAACAAEAMPTLGKMKAARGRLSGRGERG